MINPSNADAAQARPLVPVTVQVPRGSEEAFGRIASAWCEALGVMEAPKSGRGGNGYTRDQLLEAATVWWGTLNSRERAVWSLWIDAAPNLVPASRIVSELELKDAGSIKGVINRMARKGDDVGFQVGWQSDRVDPVTREKLYGVRDFGSDKYAYDRIEMTATDYADLVREARSAAESAPAPGC